MVLGVSKAYAADDSLRALTLLILARRRFRRGKARQATVMRRVTSDMDVPERPLTKASLLALASMFVTRVFRIFSVIFHLAGRSSGAK